MKISKFLVKIWKHYYKSFKGKWRKLTSNTKYAKKILNFHHMCILLCITSWDKLKLWVPFQIRINKLRSLVQSSNSKNLLNFKNFKNFLIGVEITLHKFYFISWLKFKKYFFVYEIYIKCKEAKIGQNTLQK